MSELDVELAGRREKRDELRKNGIDPYPARFDRTHRAAAIKSNFKDDAPAENVRTAGRVRAIRGHGKTTFATIEDESGGIQLYLKKDILGEKYDDLRLIDLGDTLGAAGRVFRTRAGEITIEVAELTMLAKALEPVPSQWYGLSDVETRYRRRYLDLIANPEVRETFRKRAAIVSTIRAYLAAEGFIEVETPMMQTIAGGAAARPFVTHHNALDIDLYLRIAPELYLKRLIVGGFEKVFELNRNFRNEGMDRNHNPEFTMLELYEAYADYNRMMELTESIVRRAAEAVETPMTSGWKRVSYFDAIVEGGGPARSRVVEVAREDNLVEAGAVDAECYDAVFEKYAEPLLQDPTFVIDFPTVISPLAKKKSDDPELVERFELYIGGMEIANAFSELNDPDDQETRFREQAGVAGPIDDDYVSALRVGMPPSGGLGIGIDRLAMLLTGSRTIRDVILFPAMRPE